MRLAERKLLRSPRTLLLPLRALPRPVVLLWQRVGLRQREEGLRRRAEGRVLLLWAALRLVHLFMAPHKRTAPFPSPRRRPRGQSRQRKGGGEVHEDVFEAARIVVM